MCATGSQRTREWQQQWQGLAAAEDRSKLGNLARFIYWKDVEHAVPQRRYRSLLLFDDVFQFLFRKRNNGFSSHTSRSILANDSSTSQGSTIIYWNSTWFIFTCSGIKVSLAYRPLIKLQGPHNYTSWFYKFYPIVLTTAAAGPKTTFIICLQRSLSLFTIASMHESRSFNFNTTDVT